MGRNNPEFIIIHCSAGPDRVTRDWDAIREYHKRPKHRGGRGWRDVGYHFGVELVGKNYEVVRGRSPLDSGAHCLEQNMNYRSLGICLVGGDPYEGFGEKYPLPDAQLGVAVRLCVDLCREFGIPVKNIKAHRDFATYKPCPGLGVDMDRFRATVQVVLEEEGHGGARTETTRDELKQIQRQLAVGIERLAAAIQ